MSRFGAFGPVTPADSRRASPAGSLAPLRRMASPRTAIEAKTPVPPFCFTYIPCGANGSSALFESA